MSRRMASSIKTNLLFGAHDRVDHLSLTRHFVRSRNSVNEDAILTSPSATVKHKVLAGGHMAERNDEGSSAPAEAE